MASFFLRMMGVLSVCGESPIRTNFTEMPINQGFHTLQTIKFPVKF